MSGREVWERDGQRIIVVCNCPYMIWFKRSEDDKRLRWIRKSKFHLWRHRAVRIST